jgi:hypothetical protein
MSYNLEWRPAGGSTTQVTGITDLFYDLTGLTTDTEYEFRVQEVNGSDSDYSSWTAFTTALAKDYVGDATVEVTSNAVTSFRKVISYVGNAIVKVTSKSRRVYVNGYVIPSLSNTLRKRGRVTTGLDGDNLLVGIYIPSSPSSR